MKQSTLYWALAFIILIALCGCSSVRPPCPECPQNIIKMNYPVPCAIEIAPLGDAPLPAKPPFPVNGTEEELKQWALNLGEAIEQREKILLARDAAWLAKVLNNNKGLVKCSEVDLTPIRVP